MPEFDLPRQTHCRTIRTMLANPLTFPAALTLLLLLTLPAGNAPVQAQAPPPQAPPPQAPARLEPNTAVPLLVLKEMGTGRTPTGTNVILAVERDITDPRTGKLLIRKGTPALAVVTWSQ